MLLNFTVVEKRPCANKIILVCSTVFVLLPTSYLYKLLLWRQVILNHKLELFQTGKP